MLYTTTKKNTKSLENELQRIKDEGKFKVIHNDTNYCFSISSMNMTSGYYLVPVVNYDGVYVYLGKKTIDVNDLIKCEKTLIENIKEIEEINETQKMVKRIFND